MPLFCYKRGHTVRDILCPAEPRQNPCLNCVCCSSIIKGDKVLYPTKGNNMQLNSYATCVSEYVVYMLKCPCGIVYVGQTIRKVKGRIKEHKGDNRNFKTDTTTDTPVSRHFNLHNHHVSQLKWLVLEVVELPHRGGDIRKILLQKEALWIKKLDSLTPRGMNDQWSVGCFL
ncbi:hypothetical protein XELAEV_18024832mg [Xenopus laevis]|uniref:GIY-YIG domain-containing protein n=1 Tax=Xenopus laevis TaxID=8355 RepID=A0A974D0T0_XENLA|nr:hypothetical protein XELAEV_18024832mg [Xenopus laevis]